jgi:hypothetical protein
MRQTFFKNLTFNFTCFLLMILSLNLTHAVSIDLQYDCQVINESLKQKLNFKISPGTVSSIQISGTQGNTSKWRSGNKAFDFNDDLGLMDGCEEGDNDSVGGLTLFSFSKSEPFLKGNCTNRTNSFGDIPFTQTTSTINILTVSENKKECEISLENIPFSLRVPSQIPTGNYSMEFTVTLLSI